MPRNPNATRPNANTAGATMSAPRPGLTSVPMSVTPYATAMRPMIVMPSQNALKFPGTSPDRRFSDAPPSRDELTTSRTWELSVDVKTFTNSGMIAPASVPHVITVESFRHSDPSPSVGIMKYETTYVSTTETIDVSHTRDVSGASKFILSTLLYRALAIAPLIRYE